MLKIELRRSAGLWVGVLVIVISLGLFYSLSGPWGKGTSAWTLEWTNLARWQRWQLTMLCPLALGAGAWQGRRDTRSKMDELLASMPLPAWRRVLPPVSAMVIGLAGGYFVFFAVGAVQVAGNAGYHHLGWLPIAFVGVLSLFASALLGMGIGRILPSLLTAPILAVASMAGFTVLQVSRDRSSAEGIVSQARLLLSPDVGYVREAFTTVSTKVNVAQSLWFTALLAAGFVLLTAAGRAKVFALVPVIAGLTLAVPLMPDDTASVLATDTEASALVCAEGAPRVCVSHVHQALLSSLVGPARDALAQLSRVPGAPTSVEEDRGAWFGHSSRPKIPGVAVVNFDDFYFMRDKRIGILAGPEPTCGSWQSTVEIQAARTVVVAWFNGEFKPIYRSSEPDVSTKSKPMWDSLRALPAAEQPARVAELRKVECPA